MSENGELFSTVGVPESMVDFLESPLTGLKKLAITPGKSKNLLAVSFLSLRDPDEYDNIIDEALSRREKVIEDSK